MLEDKNLNRAQREKEAWNKGIDRSFLENALSYSHVYWSIEVDKIVMSAFTGFERGSFLEIGSSTWSSWINRLRFPVSSVTCINISEAELEHGRSMSDNTDVKPHFKIMDANNLDFKEQYFDVVFGKAIIHHLDYDQSLLSIDSVLKKDGKIVFMEPVDINPVSQFVRLLTPSMRTEDEVPMRLKHFKIFEKYFNCEYFFLEFFSIPVGVISRFLKLPEKNWLSRLAFECDRVILRLPILKYCARSVIIVGSKK